MRLYGDSIEIVVKVLRGFAGYSVFDGDYMEILYNFYQGIKGFRGGYFWILFGYSIWMRRAGVHSKWVDATHHSTYSILRGEHEVMW